METESGGPETRARWLRLTWGAAKDGRSDPHAELADSGTGPSTFANRREQLVLVGKAVALLAR